MTAEPDLVPVADEDEDEHHHLAISRRQALLLAFTVACVVAFVIIVVPQLGDVKSTWSRLGDGDPWWLAVAVLMQVVSMASYVAVFQGVHVPPGSPIRYRESYQITMAGLAATRLFAAGGAGGVALTAWALRRSGMARKEVAERMIAFLVLTYAVYMAALVVCGLGLRVGLFPGPAPFSLTVVPAVIAGTSILIFLAIAGIPPDLERRLGSYQPGASRLSRLLHTVATGPARLGGGTRLALKMARHPDLALLGTIGWWGGNVGVLWASFHAFGNAPTVAVCVEGFFVGMIANLLPLPGGIGGVDASMIGVFTGFDVPFQSALIAVLVYRLLAFWLPSLPGVVAYFQLRGTVARWGELRSAERGRAGGGSLREGATIQSEVST